MVKTEHRSQLRIENIDDSYGFFSKQNSAVYMHGISSATVKKKWFNSIKKPQI